MKLFLMKHDNGGSCDVYLSLLVAAIDEQDARSIHPVAPWDQCTKDDLRQWAATPADIRVHEIGTANDGITRGILMSEYCGC